MYLCFIILVANACLLCSIKDEIIKKIGLKLNVLRVMLKEKIHYRINKIKWEKVM